MVQSCHFLFLEKKKVTKENSRQTRMLRRFAGPTHNNHSAFIAFMYFIGAFPFSDASLLFCNRINDEGLTVLDSGWRYILLAPIKK
jgi:hypothetical protein